MNSYYYTIKNNAKMVYEYYGICYTTVNVL